MGKQFKLFDINIDALTILDAIQQIADWVDRPSGVCKYVVTPNVDHVVMLNSNQNFRKAYDGAGMALIDGKPVLLAARMFGEQVPTTVTGSDLTPATFRIFNEKSKPLKVFLLGAMPGVAEIAAKNVMQRYPSIQVVGVLSPEFGFEKDEAMCEQICQTVNATNPDMLVLGLGAPKQEIWIHRYHTRLNAKVAICAGATIDFLAGKKVAPLNGYVNLTWSGYTALRQNQNAWV